MLMYFLGVFVVAANFHLPTEEVRPSASNFFGFNMADTRAETFAEEKRLGSVY